MNSPWFTVANHFTGITETRGNVDNPQILEMFKLCGHGWVQDDETPWCAAFVGACLALSGYKNTGKLNARSYLDFGRRLDTPVKGCIVVFWRQGKNSKFGHVAFFEREEDEKIVVFGGNQSAGDTEAVNSKPYPKSRLLGYFWPTEIGALPENTSLPNILQIAQHEAPNHLVGGTDEPVREYDDVGGFDLDETGGAADLDLKIGSKGALVEALQTALVKLNYALGEIDGDYGPLTRDAVLSFQANNGLPTTGVADTATLQALTNGEARTLSQKRLTTKEADLQKMGSRIINSSGWNKWLGIGTAALGLFGLTDKQLNIVGGVANGLKVAVGVKDETITKDQILGAVEQALTKAASTGTATVDSLKNAGIEALNSLVVSGNTPTTPPTGLSVGLTDSVINLGQALLGSGGFGPWGLAAAAGLFVWRNARNASNARVDDHVKAKNLRL